MCTSTSSASGSTATVIGGRVDASLRFGLGHALHPVNARLPLEDGVRAVAANLDRGLPEAALIAAGRRERLRLIAEPLRIGREHAVDVAREERRLVPARARAQLDDDVAPVVGSRSTSARRNSSSTAAIASSPPPTRPRGRSASRRRSRPRASPARPRCPVRLPASAGRAPPARSAPCAAARAAPCAEGRTRPRDRRARAPRPRRLLDLRHELFHQEEG